MHRLQHQPPRHFLLLQPIVRPRGLVEGEDVRDPGAQGAGDFGGRKQVRVNQSPWPARQAASADKNPPARSPEGFLLLGTFLRYGRVLMQALARFDHSYW